MHSVLCSVPGLRLSLSPAQLRYIKPSAVEVAGQALATAPSSGADAHVRSGAPLEGEDGASYESMGEEGDEEEVDPPDHAVVVLTRP